MLDQLLLGPRALFENRDELQPGGTVVRIRGQDALRDLEGIRGPQRSAELLREPLLLLEVEPSYEALLLELEEGVVDLERGNRRRCHHPIDGALAVQEGLDLHHVLVGYIELLRARAGPGLGDEDLAAAGYGLVEASPLVLPADGLHEDRVRVEDQVLAEPGRREELVLIPILLGIELVLEPRCQQDLEEGVLQAVDHLGRDQLRGEDPPREEEVTGRDGPGNPGGEGVLELRLRQDLQLDEDLFQEVRVAAFVIEETESLLEETDAPLQPAELDTQDAFLPIEQERLKDVRERDL